MRHGCYRGSRVQTAVWAEATAHQRRQGTFERCVTLFVAPSEFARSKLVAAGLDPARIVVKPNPVADPGEPRFGGHGAVYVGRLSDEKGPRLLLEAWRELAGLPLMIVGSGPLEAELRELGSRIPGVRFTGQLPPEGVREQLREALFLVAPSICYENFPLAVAEAMAAGKAAVASHPTAMAELVEPGRTGLLFPSGDARGARAGLPRARRRSARAPKRDGPRGARALRGRAGRRSAAPSACSRSTADGGSRLTIALARARRAIAVAHGARAARRRGGSPPPSPRAGSARRCRARRARAARDRDRVSASRSAETNSAGSVGSKSQPFSPGRSRSSAQPAWREQSTGRPQAKASFTTRPQVSASDAKISRRDAA